MRVISQSPDPLARMHTMTKRQGKSGTIDVKALLREDEEFLRALVRTALQEVLEAEMTEASSAEKGERAACRQGYRSGYYGPSLITRVGKLELRVRQDRTGRFLTELFDRYQRSDRARARISQTGEGHRAAVSEKIVLYQRFATRSGARGRPDADRVSYPSRARGMPASGPPSGSLPGF